jgi:beta-glucanase (GH16 family)
MNKILEIDFRELTAFPHDLFTIAVGEKWANNELQHYVDDEENLFIGKLGLVIKATNPKKGIYHSARIHTKGKFAFKYGQIDITAKVPKGKGTWPALWMMPEENKYGHWPKSGEIDIMEHVGRDENNLFLCLHTEKYNHRDGDPFYTEYFVEDATTSFHTYSIKWDKDSITYMIDGNEIVTYHKYDRSDQSHHGWPFDERFYLIMNMAIGGKFGGEVDDTIFPKEFIIQKITVKQ